MIKKILFTIFILLGLSLSSDALATVGGPTVLYDFKYNPVDESIYFTYVGYGGRGCPPILKKISLIDETVQTVISCEQGESLMEGNYSNGYLVNQRINEITSDFKSLTPISLKENGFSIDINFLRDEYFGENKEFIRGKTFSADIYQNKSLIDSKEVAGCEMDEPFLFDGYRIPGFEKKIILLMSAKPDCFEGGYVSDSIYVVEGVSGIDQNEHIGSYKSNSPIQPSRHTLIVYESDDVQPIEDPILVENTNSEKETGYIVTITVGLISFIIGIILGRFIFVKKESLV